MGRGFRGTNPTLSSKGLSRPLLKFSGGSGDILRDVLHRHDDPELLIASAKSGDEPGHVPMTFQSAKAL